MINSSVCAGQKWWSGAGSNRRPSAFQGFYQPETMIRRNTADHSYPHWHWSEGSHSSYQPCHRVPHNPVSFVGLLWGTTAPRTCGDSVGLPRALRMLADAPSKNLEPIGGEVTQRHCRPALSDR